MTNMKDESEPVRDCNPRKAALLAVHLVSQVLDEAYVIANAAKETGQPWRSLSMLQSFKETTLDQTYIEQNTTLSYEASKGDNENKIEVLGNVATSTPQKLASKYNRGPDDNQNIHGDFIGQGDEECEIRQEDTTNSTSMFINHLFDMSDVERVIICDDNDYTSEEPNELLAEAMVKMMDSYVSNNIMTVDIPVLTDEDAKEQNVPTYSDNTLAKSDSDFSFLADAFISDVGKNVAFFIDEDIQHENQFRSYDSQQNERVVEIKNEQDLIEAETQRNDVSMYEKAFMTLNRDYDQCSDEDGFPVLQDPKEMNMQEVELLTARTSEENLSYFKDSKQKVKEEVATVSAASGSRKTLARRCRMQGARLLACIRGWWRRKTPAKRRKRMQGYPYYYRLTYQLALVYRTKEPRMLDGVKGVCPLSPDARRRTSSMLDSRRMRSPSPSRPLIWKFNTVNEALVNSNRWKDYTFDANSGQI